VAALREATIGAGGPGLTGGARGHGVCGAVDGKGPVVMHGRRVPGRFPAETP